MGSFERDVAVNELASKEWLDFEALSVCRFTTSHCLRHLLVSADAMQIFCSLDQKVWETIQGSKSASVPTQL